MNSQLGLISGLVVSLLLIVSSAQSDSDDDGSNDTMGDSELTRHISDFKDKLIPCRNLLQLVVTRKIEAKYRIEIQRGLEGCENHYTQMIEKILDDLGIIGRAMQEWLQIIGRFLLTYEDEKITDQDDIYEKPHLHMMLDPTINRDEQDPDVNYYLESAFLYGLGICTHLDQDPLLGIMSDLFAYWRYGLFLEREIGEQHEFVFFIELQARGEESGQMPLLILMLALTNICKSLGRNPMAEHFSEIYRVSRLPDAINQFHHPSLDVNHYPDGLDADDVALLMAAPYGRKCNQADYYRFKRGFRFTSSLYQDENSEAMFDIMAIAQIFVETCYSRLAPSLFTDGINLIPDDMESYVFTNMARQMLNSYIVNNQNGDNLNTMANLALRTRAFVSITPGEKLFFQICVISHLVDYRNSLAAFLNGSSGPCRFYSEFEDLYKVRNSLFELIELFNNMASIDRFWNPMANEATGFYFMWTICRQNRLLVMAKVH